MTISCTIRQAQQRIPAISLFDIGASGYAFIDNSFALQNKIPLRPLPSVLTLTGFDGKPVDTGFITHAATLTLDIQGHVEKNMPLYATNLRDHDIVLGNPWKNLHEVQFGYRPESIVFNSTYCLANCTPIPLQIPTATAHKKILPTTFEMPSTPLDSRSASPRSDDKKNVTTKKVRFQEDPQTCYGVATLPRSHIPGTQMNRQPVGTGCKPSMRLKCAQMEAVAFYDLATDPTNQTFECSLRDLDRALDNQHQETKLRLAISKEDIAAYKKSKDVDPSLLLPSQYHDLLPVFDRQESNELPPHRSYDHAIDLNPGKEPPYGPLYGMSREETEELRKELETQLTKGFIRASKSPAASPVLFVRKPGGGLRFCVDYRGLNEITIKNRYPLPLITETLARLSQAKVYTKLDIISAFNRLRIKEGDEWKTAFRTRFGLFEYLVLPFGLCNGPASFQHYINDTLREHLDVFCTAYLDDILIHSESLEEHENHVRRILQKLQVAGLQVDITKCEFHATEVAYRGLIVTTDGIKMDPKKIKTVIEWPQIQNVKDVQSFLGFANFYRRFIYGFSKIAMPLNALSQKDKPFLWSQECEKAFETLKKAFTSDSILIHFDAEKEIIVETDASDFVSGGILSQYDSQGILRPVAYFSKKHTPAECNYEIYDKELMAIVRAFEEWRPELEGSAFPISVITDHKNLEYFTTTKQLSRRQARWNEFMSRFQFKITYRPGKLAVSPMR